MAWFKDTNVDMAELASVYRTPNQGVSAKSNSNISFTDYRHMPPQANGSNNTLGANGGNQTLRFDDLHDTGGVVGGSSTYTTGSTKGAQSRTLTGAFTAHGASVVRADGSATSQGYMKLGSQSGTPDLRGVGSFGVPTTFSYYLEGIGSEQLSLGGSFFVVVRGSGYQASAPAANSWSTIRVRNLLANGGGFTTNFNQSDGASPIIWSSTVSGTTRIWSASHGLAGVYSNAIGWVGNTTHSIEFI